MRRTVLVVLLALVTAPVVLAVSSFSPQLRLGYRTGDQWEPAIAADDHGHIYVLYPQYGAVPDCPACTAPSIALIVSSDNGLTWQPSQPLSPSPTGQFDPQIVVDPLDRQTVYASWMQNNKHDVVVARSLDYGRTWSFSWAERSREDTDKPVLAVRGADVYVGFNHDERFLVAASHDAGQTFTLVHVNANAEPGSSLAGGATVDPAGNIYFGWTAYARHDMPLRPVSVYVSRSTDGGRTWGTVLLDQSSAPPGCEAESCETGYLGAQIALASDTEGALYALWNAGTANGGPDAFISRRRPPLAHPGPRAPMYRLHHPAWSTPFRQSWLARPATSASHGWIPERMTWIITVFRSGILSTAARPTAARPGARKRNSPVRHAATITFFPTASASRSETTLAWRSTAKAPLTPSGAKASTTSLPDRSGTLTADSED